jgi:creatinine amidohydrolase
MTAPEVRSRAEADGSILVVPVGSVEQHGHHLPTGTDTMLADAVTRSATDRVDLPVVRTPPVWTGVSPHHTPLGGTLTLSATTLLRVLRETAESAVGAGPVDADGLDNGFDAVLFLNGHGGNMSVLSTAATEVGRSRPDLEVLSLTYFQLVPDEVAAWRESETGGMAHAGEFETALMLHLYPDLVEDDRPAELLDEPYDAGNEDLQSMGPLGIYRTFDEYAPSGAIGDPEVTTPEAGEALFGLVGDALADLLREVRDRNA